MYLNLLSDNLSWGDRLNYMGIGVLLGVAVVFSVLALLWIILELFGKIFGSKSKAEKPAAKPAPAPAKQAPAPVVQSVPAVQTSSAVQAAPAMQTSPAASAPETGDDAIIAAITAALAVYLEAQGPKAPSVNGFRVVSFKKVGNAAHWNQN